MANRSAPDSSFSLLLQRQLAAAFARAPMTSGEMRAVTPEEIETAADDTVRWSADPERGSHLPDELTDWLDTIDAAPPSLEPLGASLSEADRGYLRGRWLRTAKNEHEAIGTFARITLDLMNVLAPLELLSATQEAGLAAVRHAEMSLELAARFGGGRRELPEHAADHSVPLVSSLEELVVCVFHEMCVGPVLGAVRGAEQLSHADSPDTTRALASILASHTAAAELGWAILAWALRAGGPAVRGALLGAAASAREQIRAFDPAPLPSEVHAEALRRFGALSPGEEREAFLRAWRKVVLPGLEELLKHWVAH